MTQVDRVAPVLIVGGGPTGLSVALELAHHGVECLLVEQRIDVSHDRPRAKTTSARTMEHFRRWGVADDIRAAAPLSPEWSDRVVFCDSLTGRQITHFEDCFGLRTDLAAERGQQIPQPSVEEVLRAHVVAQPIITAIFGATVTAIEHPAPELAVATVIHADGRTERIEAQWVLGCDGSTAMTRAAAGVAMDGGSDPRSNFNVVFRAPDLSTDLGPAVQYWVVGSEVPGVLGRLDLEGTWWAIAPGVDPATGAADPSALVEALVGRRVDHQIVSTDPWTARMLVAERYRSGRIFLVGDAAHLNPPWGGHGYNTGIGDAVNIAWKLAAVLQGWGRPALLDSYDAERRPIAESTIRLATSNMSTLATDLADGAHSDIATLAEQIQDAKAPEFHSLGLVLGYSYAGSPVVASTGEPSEEADDTATYVASTAPGRLLPHTLMPDGRPLYDHLGRALTLIGPVLDDTEGVRLIRERARTLGVDLTLIEAPDTMPSDEFLLVRPDQHVAARARGTCADLNLDHALGHSVVQVAITSPGATGTEASTTPRADLTPQPTMEGSTR